MQSISKSCLFHLQNPSQIHLFSPWPAVRAVSISYTQLALLLPSLASHGVLCTIATVIFRNSEIRSCHSPAQNPFPGIPGKTQTPHHGLQDPLCSGPSPSVHCLPLPGLQLWPSLSITHLLSSWASQTLCTRCGLCKGHSDWFLWLTPS